jgi:small conductance mechanosensitive channel
MVNNLLTAAETTEEAATSTTSSFDWSGLLDTVVNWMTSTGIKLVIAIVLMIITFKIVNVITKKLYKRLQKKNVDETIARVGSQALRISLKLVILVCLVGYVGIETASISAVIASLGVGISLAVQGTLSNFAGGVIIIVMRPFKIGDFITSNGESGTVEDIKLFYTHIVTTDNRAVVIPNGTLANNVIVNASAKDTRRCDITVSAAYGSDIDKVKTVIEQVCAENELIFKDPAPFVMLSKMGESSLDFVVRAWCKREDYWTVNFYLLDAVKKAFDKNGIEIPFNQLDVTIKNKTEDTSKAD